MKRREFLAASAATVGSLALAGKVKADATPTFKTKLKPAAIGAPSEANLQAWSKAGFKGLEVSGGANVIGKPHDEAAKDRETAAKHGLEIHSVLFGWGSLNSKKPEEVKACQDRIRGHSSSRQRLWCLGRLLVPCRVGGMAMPQPWEFDITLDEKTSMVKSVVAGDNSKYADYIEAQNWATESSRKAISELIPDAEKAGVVIAIENVWNNLWISPELMASFAASFDSPWVQSYFDIGNHVKYNKPTNYIAKLGKLIKKVHIKDFKLNPDGHGGTFVEIREAASTGRPSARHSTTSAIAASSRLKEVACHLRNRSNAWT